jgi:hypothetical protein
MKKRIIILFVAVLTVFLINGCTKKIVNGDTNTEGKGYGITYKDHVGYAHMKVKNQLVDTVTFDEAFLPNTWAGLKVGIETVPEEVIVDGSTWKAKYIVIGDKHFTGALRETSLTESKNQTVKYSAEGIEDLYLWLKDSEANCKWYYEQVSTDKAYIAKVDWTKSTLETTRKGWLKSTAGYWPSTDTTLGWSGNMSKISEALKGTKMDASGNLTQNDEKFWVVNGVITGATLVNFKDYYEIAKRAYKNAK